MLGLLFIYFIGKYFYKLAEDFHQNKWLYAVIGVVVYYAGTAIGGILAGIFALFTGMAIDWENNVLMSVIGLPFGIGADYLCYYLLKKKWEKENTVPADEIQDIGRPEEE